MAWPKGVSRGRDTEGSGAKGVAEKLRKTKIEPGETTEEDTPRKLPPSVISELKPGALIEKAGYVVKIISVEKGYMNRDIVRYRKGFLNQETGKTDWSAEASGNLAQIEAWLLKGR